jgi:hypothetical protein
MLRREQMIYNELLDLSTMDKLAELCPKCFGPPASGKKPDEPDYIVCMDGNFQHRRHKAASHEIVSVKTPALFINPDDVQQMAVLMNDTRIGGDETRDLLVSMSNYL